MYSTERSVNLGFYRNRRLHLSKSVEQVFYRWLL